MEPGGPCSPTFWPNLVGVQDQDILVEQSPVTYSNRTVIYCGIAVKSFLYSYSVLDGSVVGIDFVEGPEYAVTFFFFLLLFNLISTEDLI